MRRDSRFSARVLQAFERPQLPATLAVHAAIADQPAEILVYDEIGPWGITAGAFVSALAQAGDGPLRVRINSPGGDVFDGMAMYNALARHPAAVECVVDGIAASAASFLAMAGRVTMAEESMMMIHNAWGVVIGNRSALLETADVLGKIDGQMAGIYARKSGKTAEDMAAAMDAETWYTAQEAADAGLCDEVAPVPQRQPEARMRPAACAAMLRRLRMAESQ